MNATFPQNSNSHFLPFSYRGRADDSEDSGSRRRRRRPRQERCGALKLGKRIALSRDAFSILETFGVSQVLFPERAIHQNRSSQDRIARLAGSLTLNHARLLDREGVAG